MAQSLVDTLKSELVIYVATDDENIANSINFDKSKSQKVVVHKIPSYGWPDATLRRYEIFEKFLDEISEDYISYLDADMRINRDFAEILKEDLEQNEVILVSHPGFYRTRGYSRMKFYLKNIDVLVTDLRTLVRYGALGSWETNSRSLAFVNRQSRNKYVCGGFWIGKNKAIKTLIRDLSSNVKKDTENYIVAKWHDESHLNNWASKNMYKLQNSRFCFDETYKNLEGLENVITAIRK
jgi:hypothetical protein